MALSRSSGSRPCSKDARNGVIFSQLFYGFGVSGLLQIDSDKVEASCEFSVARRTREADSNGHWSAGLGGLQWLQKTPTQLSPHVILYPKFSWPPPPIDDELPDLNRVTPRLWIKYRRKIRIL